MRFLLRFIDFYECNRTFCYLTKFMKGLSHWFWDAYKHWKRKYRNTNTIPSQISVGWYHLGDVRMCVVRWWLFFRSHKYKFTFTHNLIRFEYIQTCNLFIRMRVKFWLQILHSITMEINHPTKNFVSAGTKWLRNEGRIFFIIIKFFPTASQITLAQHAKKLLATAEQESIPYIPKKRRINYINGKAQIIMITHGLCSVRHRRASITKFHIHYIVLSNI